MLKEYPIYSALCRSIFFLFPLIFILPQQFSRNLYQSTPFWIVISLGIALLPAAYKSIKKTGFRKVTIFFVAYLISLGLATLFSTDISTSLPILVLNSAYFIIFLTSGEILSSLKAKEIFVSVFLVICALLSVISFYNTYIQGYIDITSEGLSFMWGYFGHNHVAVLLIAAIPLCVYFLLFSKRWIKLGFGLLLVFFLYSFLISFSRAAILALSSSLVFGGIVFYKDYFRKTNIGAAIVIGLVTTVLLSSLLLVLNIKSTRSIYIRTFHLQKGVEMFFQKPIIGFGPGTFGEAKVQTQFTRQTSFYVHNLLVQNLAEGGIILLTATVIFYSVLIVNLSETVKTVSNHKNKYFSMALWIGVVGILINEMMDFDLQLPAIGVLFWMMAGLICFSKTNGKT